MDQKTAFPPFALVPASAGPNPFLAAPIELAASVQATDAVWSHDAGDEEDPEAPRAEAVDVRILWGTNVLHFEQMSPPRPFTLGGAGADFTLPELGSTVATGGSCPLVVLRDERAAVFAAAETTVEVKLVNGSVLSLAACVENGTAQRLVATRGAHEILLPHGATATVRLPGSELVFEVTRARARQRPDAGFWAGADFSGQVYTGLSALVHATLVGALAFLLPAMHADDAESVDRNAAAAMRPYLDAIAERARERDESDESVLEVTPSAPSGGGRGARASGASGSLGSTSAAVRTSGRYAIRGQERDTRLARDRAIAEASTFGVLDLLRTDTSNVPTAPWADRAAFGRDPTNALGKMWALSIDDALGTGGLGLLGPDQGGGGLAAGVGLRGINSTVGHGDGDLDGDGPATGPGHELGPGGHGPVRAGLPSHIAVAPRLREIGDFSTSGTLPRELIQRVVRQHFGRFRLCYEDGLRGNPGLTGRVAVKFVIDRDGGVTVASADPGTDMADAKVVACVVRGFQNLTFPAPKDGMVRVVYPLMLAPGE